MKKLARSQGVIAALALGAGMILALGGTAKADVVVYCQNIQGGTAGSGALLGCTQQQGNSLTTENILFNSSAAVTSGTTVVGVTQTSDTLFDFTSTQQLLVNSGNGGFATINPTGTDTYIANLQYYVAPVQTLGSTYNAFTVLDTNLDVSQNTSGTVTWVINALNSLGQAETFTTVTFALTGGANNFTFIASNGEVIDKVSYTATNVTDVMVQDVKQTSVTLGNNPPTVTPEPASLALLGTALAGLGLVTRRRRTS